MPGSDVPRPAQKGVGTIVLLADQGISSATNFAASVLAIRASDGAEFAQAGIALVLVRLTIGVARSWSAEASVTYAADLTNVRQEIGRSARTGAGCSLVLSLVFLAVLALTNSLTLELGLFVLLGGVVIGAGEAARATALLSRHMLPALMYDSVWALVMIGWLVVARPQSPGGVLLIWAGSSGVALVVFVRALLLKGPDTGPSFRQRLGVAMEAMADRGGSQVATLILAFGLPATLSAGFTAARNLLAPLNPIAIAVFNLAFPASRSAHPAARGRLIIKNVAVISGGVTIVCAVSRLIPYDSMLTAVGPTWDVAYSFVVPVGMAYAAMLFVQAAASVARGAGFAPEVRLSRLIAAAMGFFPSLVVFVVVSPNLNVVVAVSGIALLGSLQFVAYTWHKVTVRG